MKKSLSLFLALLIVSVHCFCGFSFVAEASSIESASNNTEFAIETAKIIKDSDSPSSMLRIIGKFSKKPSDSVFSQAEKSVVSDDGRFVLQFSSEKALFSCLEQLKNNSDIIYAEQDRPVYTESLQESTNYLSWGVKAIEADIYSKSISLASADSSVTVAIVDSGSEDIDFISDKLVPGYDFVDNDSDAANDESIDSHGTFLASIIADCTRDIPVKIMPVRVLESETGTLINAINGIYYATDNGADIINISLCGVLSNCSSLDDAIDYAEQHDVTVVVCAGNAKSNIKNYCPAHNENAITVTSVNSENQFSDSFSNYGDMVDFAAPGENITGYNASGERVALSGTSMSTAFVSAAAAIFRLENPRCNTEQVRDSLISCAVDCGSIGHDIYYGWGVLKLGSLANSDITYVESVSFEQENYSLSVGEALNISPVFYPADATDKSFTLSSDSSNISINGNRITAVSQGTAVLTVTSNDGSYSDTVEITVNEKSYENKPTLKIQNNPETKTINFGEILRLTAIVSDKPENTTIWWYANGAKIGEGEIIEVSPKDGSIVVTAKLVDINGEPVLDENSDEITDSQTVSVNSSFFQRIISFFKNLFGINRTVIQSVFKIIY